MKWWVRLVAPRSFAAHELGELRGRAPEHPVIVHGVVVVAGHHELRVGAVHGPHVALEDVVDLLAGQQLLDTDRAAGARGSVGIHRREGTADANRGPLPGLGGPIHSCAYVSITGAGMAQRTAIDADLEAGEDRWLGNHRSAKVSELLARDILSDIEERSLRPGAKLLPETAMLRRYGVGRASLREALRILEIYGIIKIKPGPGGGPVVDSVDSADFGRASSFYLNVLGRHGGRPAGGPGRAGAVHGPNGRGAHHPRAGRVDARGAATGTRGRGGLRSGMGPGQRRIPRRGGRHDRQPDPRPAGPDADHDAGRADPAHLPARGERGSHPADPPAHRGGRS